MWTGQEKVKNGAIIHELFLVANFCDLSSETGYANCADVFPVYIGDDRTDEDAFKVHRTCG